MRGKSTISALAIVLAGLMTSCSHEESYTSLVDSKTQAYSEVFTSEYGKIYANHDWGFGSTSAEVRTRATAQQVTNPTVATMGTYTFNAELALAWKRIEENGVTDQTALNAMANYEAWRNSGWEDQYYQINATISDNGISESDANTLHTAIREQLPEGVNNLAMANETGYTITTKGGEVTLTPIYNVSNSTDRISYYYYQAGQKPSDEEIKQMPKYCIGTMGDNLYKTFKLVYVDSNGQASYNFPSGYVIEFIVTNVSRQDGNPISVYNDGGFPTETVSKEKYAIEAGTTPAYGSKVTGNYVELQYGKGTGKDFIAATANNGVSGYTAYTEGNETNGGKDGGTEYYLTAKADGEIEVAVVLNANKKFYILDETTGNAVSGYNGLEKEAKYYGTFRFAAQSGHTYKIYAAGTKLGFYGYEFFQTIGGETVSYKSIPETPDYYAYANLNTCIHNSGETWGLNSYSQGITDPVTPHNAVFSINGKNYLGFEDWTDFDFNDVIFQVEGTTGGKTIVLEGDVIPKDDITNTQETSTTVYQDVFKEKWEIVEQGRVFCEDLGKISRNDLDFNDVVFDAYVYKVTPMKQTITTYPNGSVSEGALVADGDPYYRTNIVLLAAGGTLPLTLAGREVHNVLGKVGNNIIINTITSDEGSYSNPWMTCDPVDMGYFSYSSIAEVPINVLYSNGEVLQLRAESGEAPHKIVVPIGTKWAQERVKVDEAYTDFERYVTTKYDFWSGNKDTNKLYYHSKDNYTEKSATPQIKITKYGEKTYDRSTSTSQTGGYQGGTVLSRKR